jgi:hypothetical protein
MNDIEKTRISEIRQLHDEIGGAIRTTLDKAIRVGELLAEQKASMEHGEWLPWIEENLSFSDRLARDYMRFYEKREELKSASLANLTEARKLLAVHNDEPDYGLVNRLKAYKGEEIKNKLDKDSLSLIPSPGKGIIMNCPVPFPLSHAVAFIEPDIVERGNDPSLQMYFITAIYMFPQENMDAMIQTKGVLAEYIAHELYWWKVDYDKAAWRFEYDRGDGWMWEKSGKLDDMVDQLNEAGFPEDAQKLLQAHKVTA